MEGHIFVTHPGKWHVNVLSILFFFFATQYFNFWESLTCIYMSCGVFSVPRGDSCASLHDHSCGRLPHVWTLFVLQYCHRHQLHSATFVHGLCTEMFALTFSQNLTCWWTLYSEFNLSLYAYMPIFLGFSYHKSLKVCSVLDTWWHKVHSWLR